MNFQIVTIFPSLIKDMLSYGIIGKALKSNLIIVNTLKEIDEINNLSNRNESINKYDKIDDYILSITNILDAKDKNVFSIIKEIIAGD